MASRYFHVCFGAVVLLIVSQDSRGQTSTLEVVSAASFRSGAPVAPGMIVSGFGEDLSREAIAATANGPTELLNGMSVRLKDASGTSRGCAIFFASSRQINFVVPLDTGLGPAQVTVYRDGTAIAQGVARVAAASPGLFSANGTGTGFAAGIAQALRAGETVANNAIAEYRPDLQRFVSVPVDLGAPDVEIYLSLFGTGFRGARDNVSASLDGIPVEVTFVGPQGQYAGLDQINIGPLPQLLSAGARIPVRLLADGQEANIVTMAIGDAMTSGPGVAAFPGAEGYGAGTPGGRGGRVIAVTTLADSGPGSLRAALRTSGPRIIVFRVSGTIEVQSQMPIAHPYVTVAGQTAPGDGIALRAAASSSGQMIAVQTHDVVLRYLRIRSGKVGSPASGQVNIQIENGAHDVVIDHCSLSWTLDENLNITRNIPSGTAEHAWPDIYNVTLQRSILAEGLLPHSTGSRVGGEFAQDGWRGIHEISYHHNLFAGNNARNPNVATTGMQIVNNLVYAWGSELAATVAGSRVDWIGNYFKPVVGSAIRQSLVHNHFLQQTPNEVFATPSLYMRDNFLDSVDLPSDAGETSNGKTPILRDWEIYEIHYSSEPIPDSFRRATPIPQARFPITIETSAQTLDSVLSDVGANARVDCNGLLVRNSDSADLRYIDAASARDEFALISNPAEKGGYPVLTPAAACPDADLDGMPDAWEAFHSLDNNLDDSAGYQLHPDYTNIETYLNGSRPANRIVPLTR